MGNFNGFKGFRLDKEKYSMFSHEQECILAEGMDVYIVGCEEKV